MTWLCSYALSSTRYARILYKHEYRYILLYIYMKKRYKENKYIHIIITIIMHVHLYIIHTYVHVGIRLCLNFCINIVIIIIYICIWGNRAHTCIGHNVDMYLYLQNTCIHLPVPAVGDDDDDDDVAAGWWQEGSEFRKNIFSYSTMEKRISLLVCVHVHVVEIHMFHGYRIYTGDFMKNEEQSAEPFFITSYTCTSGIWCIYMYMTQFYEIWLFYINIMKITCLYRVFVA